jgi:hypothetical protein
MNRPTIFLSSTIYDFHDLRSALKDYLELRGCTVFASEQNDFEKELDVHSYDACLKTIEKCDLFVLFIGSRVGGLKDEAEKQSITRAEYEHAYKRAKTGDIRILSFVRRDVWTYREAVKELERHLKLEATQLQERPIDRAPTKFMTDAEAIIAFIELVSRNSETSKASKGQGEFPVANWVHQFSTFAEVRSAIDPLIFAGLEVPQAAGRAALYNRLTALLQVLLLKGSSRPFTANGRIRELVGHIGLTIPQAMTGLTIDQQTWTTLIVMLTHVIPISVDPGPLVPFLSDPLLLAYDPKTGAFRETEEHRALNDLIQAIEQFGRASKNFDAAEFMVGKNGNEPSIRVDGQMIATLLHLLLRLATMTDLALALARAMNGQPFVRPVPMPRGPFVDQEDGLEKEVLTLDAVRSFIEGRDGAAEADAQTGGR